MYLMLCSEDAGGHYMRLVVRKRGGLTLTLSRAKPGHFFGDGLATAQAAALVVLI
jgi:hypothetical protein